VKAEDGKIDAVIVQSARPTEAEAFAATELADFLKRVTGAELPIVKESDFKGGRAIYLGQTDFAALQNIDFAKLDPEEWVIRSARDSLVISGGRPRGTLYGVYEFLEKCLGVRFLDARTEHMPDKPKWDLPADLAIHAKPAFPRREIFMVAGGAGSAEFQRFQVRRKINAFANACLSAGPKYGHSLRFGSPYSTHTHHHYTKDFPADKPEYFALRENGSRTGPGPDGQVCMSHPEVRRLFATKLREYILQERLAFDETLLYLWEPLNAVRPLPFKREEVLKRLQQNYEAAYRKYGGWGEANKKEDDARLEYLRNMPPVPPQFGKKKIIDLCGPLLNLSQGGGGFPKSIADRDAAAGKAWRLDSSAQGEPGRHNLAPNLGLYDNQSKALVEQVIPKDKVPRDEKYRFHFAGRMKGSATLDFWAHPSWRLSQRLKMAYNPALPGQKTYDVYASVKLEGPAYVPGSTKENSFSIDRVILVEVTE
jgi:hypothetical protein